MDRAKVTHEGVPRAWSAVACSSVVEIAESACKRWPDRPAVIFEDGLVVSREDLLRRSLRFTAFIARNSSPGGRIAVMLENRVESMVAFIAILAAGCVLVSINPASGKHDAGHILRDSSSAVLITSETLMPLIESIRPSCPALKQVLAISRSEPHGLEPFSTSADGTTSSMRRPGRKDIAAIYYTSGTTGLPKGCLLDHEWWLRLCDIHLRLTVRAADHRPLCCLPFHNADSMFQLLCALHVGGTLIAMRRFSVSRFWTVVVENSATELFLLASMPILLLKQAPHALERAHRLRTVVCAAVPEGLHRELNARFAVEFLDSYGSTEAGWVTRMPRLYAEEMTGLGSIGVPVPDVELRIVDESARDVPVGTAGELLIRGPGIFIEYLNNAEATAHALREGWYHTGDLVRADTRGFYYFLGRNRDVIRRSGANIAAAEVEAVLRLYPAVIDAAVIPVPDALRGEEVEAHVLVEQGAISDNELPHRIIAHCADQLAPFKLPRYLVLRTEEFPRTPTMRIRKDELKAKDSASHAWDRESGRWRGERKETNYQESQEVGDEALLLVRIVTALVSIAF